jgi:hypothetical protein
MEPLEFKVRAWEAGNEMADLAAKEAARNIDDGERHGDVPY